MNYFLKILFIFFVVSRVQSLAFDCRFTLEEQKMKIAEKATIEHEIKGLQTQINVVRDAYKQIEEYKNKQRLFFKTNVAKMTAYLGYQTYKEIKPLFGSSGKFSEVLDWARSKAGPYITFDSFKVGGYTPNAQSAKDQIEGEYEKKLWGKGYYNVDIKPINTAAKDFVKEVNELKKFENYSFDAYRAYAQTHTKLGNTKEIKETKDTTIVLLRGKTLVEKCEAAQKALVKIREELPKTISKLKSDLVKIDKDVEKIQKQYKECSQANQDLLKKATESPVIDTGLKITSNAKKEEDRKREIEKKARELLLNLYWHYNKIKGEYDAKYKQNYKKYYDARDSIKTSIRICGYRYDGDLGDVDESCFKMDYTFVSEIKRWDLELPKYISKVRKKLEIYKQIVKDLKKDLDKEIGELVNVQGRINEVMVKYKSYLPRDYNPKYNIANEFSYKFNPIQKDIVELTETIKKSDFVKQKIKKGLKARVDYEKKNIKPYSSIESDFSNSLTQIRDAIVKIEKIYKSEDIVKIEHHQGSFNQENFKKLKSYIALLPTQEKQKDEINKIIQKLTKEQQEVDHQANRLKIGQMNALHYYKLMRDFIATYTNSGPYVYEDIQEDIKEVTGVTLKNADDILEEWENGDFRLWIIRDNIWFINPDGYTTLKYIINDLKKKTIFNRSPEQIYELLRRNKSLYLAMDAETWSKTFNVFSSSLTQTSIENMNIKDKSINDMIVKSYNLMYEIDSFVMQKDNIQKALPILQKDIKDANNLLEKKENIGYRQMIYRLQNDTKEGTEAYYARNTSTLAPMFVKINDLIKRLQDARKNFKITGEQNKTDVVRKFYTRFKEAYESKDVSAVTANLSNDWSSSMDGTSISDLEMYLENSFRVFDEIQFNISNLDIQPMGNNKYRVSYDVSIIGEIYDNDITHEEKSSVQEEVGIKNGKILILKTFGGQYWSIK